MMHQLSRFIMIIIHLLIITNVKTQLINTANCGKSDITNPYIKQFIIGGDDAELGEYPWMVSLQIPNNNGKLKHFCGASVINDRWILTSAHCVEYARKLFGRTLIFKKLKLMIGDVNYERNDQTTMINKYYNAERIIVAGCYLRSRLFDDIALIKTDKNINMFNDTINEINMLIVNSICLPQNHSHLMGTNGLISGWGNWKPETPPKVLQKAEVRLFDSEECRHMILFSSVGQILPSQSVICSMGHSESPAGVCDGDSGGPLMEIVNGRVQKIGIASFVLSFSKCSPKFPAVYTRVSNYIDWIMNNIENTENSFRKYVITNCG